MISPPGHGPDDADGFPLPTSVARRGFLAGAAVSMLLAACNDGPSGSGSKVAPTPAPRGDPAFLKLSRALTGHDDLDPILAARISDAFGKLFPDMKARFPALGALSKDHAGPDEMLRAATAADLGDVALAVVAAWYSGTVGKGDQAIPLAYAGALMNRPVADALAPPTYQLGGPGWWTAEPPPVGVAPPARSSVS